MPALSDHNNTLSQDGVIPKGAVKNSRAHASGIIKFNINGATTPSGSEGLPIPDSTDQAVAGDPNMLDKNAIKDVIHRTVKAQTGTVTIALDLKLLIRLAKAMGINLNKSGNGCIILNITAPNKEVGVKPLHTDDDIFGLIMPIELLR